MKFSFMAKVASQPSNVPVISENSVAVATIPAYAEKGGTYVNEVPEYTGSVAL